MGDVTQLKKEVKKLKGMLETKGEIKEIKSLLKEFKGMAVNIRAESSYLMDKIAKDRMAKTLLPHYPFFIEIIKRSGVLVTGDKFQSALIQINANFSDLNGTVKKLEESILILMKEIDNIKRRSLYGRISEIFRRFKGRKGN